jgi:hypothetical protein
MLVSKTDYVSYEGVSEQRADSIVDGLSTQEDSPISCAM